MKKILIVYNTMCIGGSTTSLLSILNNIDNRKYEIDLLLAKNDGELMHLIPSKVNILPQAYPDNLFELKKKSIKSNIKYIYSKIISYKKPNSKNIMGQIMTYENARFSRKITKEYDVAISFLENFPLNYVSKYVKAKKKVTWIHVDYIGAGFIAKYDRKCYKNFDKIVLVSKQCLDSFNNSFPEYKDKSIVIENILISKTLMEMSTEPIDLKIDKNYINLVSVCRITFDHKGLDRVITALKELKKINIQDKLRWYVIGDGVDFEKLKSMIYKYGLEEVVILLGEKKNPFPYEIYMDAFLLPSRYEGKPMAVTEAQMLGVPPIVTNYASAKSQINNMIDGIIIENKDNSITDILKYIVDNTDVLLKMKRNIENNNYDNLSEINKVIDLLEG